MWQLRSTLLLLLLTAIPVASLHAQKVPCADVLRALHRVERLGGLRGGDPGRIAKSLGTTAGWVERCAEVYGRRLQTKDLSERRAQQEASWESDEFEESSAEEIETENDVVVDAAPYRDKVRQREFSLEDEDWEPFEHREWKPNSGNRWNPYLYDPHRTMESDVDGLVTQ